MAIRDNIERVRRAGRELTGGEVLAIAGVAASVLALGFGLAALVSYYIIDEEEPAPDPYFAWGPFATICSFVAVGVLLAARKRKTLYGEWAFRAGAALLALAVPVAVFGVVQAAWNDESTISHGIGWLAFAQPAAVVGVGWLLYAEGRERPDRT